MIGYPLGLLYGNATEWFIHKYLLHGRGADRRSFWSFHWHDHHKTARQNEMHDDKYRNRLFRNWDPQAKEAVALLAGALAHLPLLPVAPFFVAGVFTSSAMYYYVHKRSHLDETWAKKHVPWHWDHHMGPNQHSNWCVTYPLFDFVMRTREPYLNTEAEVASRERKRAIFERRQAQKDAAAGNNDDTALDQDAA